MTTRLVIADKIRTASGLLGDALLIREGRVAAAGQAAAQGPRGDATSDLLYLNVYEIDDNPFQPRRDFSTSEIGSKASSVAILGVVPTQIGAAAPIVLQVS